jgi:hypothetical protein
MRSSLVKGLLTIAQGGQAVYITRIDGGDPANSELSAALIEAGFTRTARGYLLRAEDRSLWDERRGRE